MTFTPASYPEGNQAGLDTEPGFSIAAWQQRPESLGWVTIKSSDPFEKPIIQPNYLSAPEDQRVAVEGIRLSRKLMHSNALSKYLDHELYPGKGVGDSFDELLDIARERGLTCYHQMGTCRMGPSADKTAVVNNELKVYGIENMVLCASNIAELKKSHEYYEGEKHKIESLEKICSDEGMEPVIFNLSEYMKSGAMLSCMVMHLNRVDHFKTLL